ncbi:hypothetical protein A6P39_025740 [Streptomyces sp. FXJ1.172]|uniref:hypothetical protein n=1 Tax=Streptomyces sp. FXJ1.172 TaxID=710705 RepID=UPI0007CF0A28|nr:hypothetical protein [Streptomyces sp. FXJ1.172]WEO97142.1 hypothetical protein A6P39_025740 [Streptomyces sp. FXJ1.172]
MGSRPTVPGTSPWAEPRAPLARAALGRLAHAALGRLAHAALGRLAHAALGRLGGGPDEPPPTGTR